MEPGEFTVSARLHHPPIMILAWEYRLTECVIPTRDACAGGILAAIAQGKSLETAIDMGHWLASLSIRELGPSYVFLLSFDVHLSSSARCLPRSDTTNGCSCRYPFPKKTYQQGS